MARDARTRYSSALELVAVGAGCAFLEEGRATEFFEVDGARALSFACKVKVGAIVARRMGRTKRRWRMGPLLKVPAQGRW